MKNKRKINFFLLGSLLMLGMAKLAGQSYHLVSTGPPAITSKAGDVQIRFLPNNQVEYAVAEGQWRGWTLVFEWGPPQITYQPDGQLLSISTKGWVVNAGPPQRGATIGVDFRGIGNENRLLSEGRAYAGFSAVENRYVNNEQIARVKITPYEEPEITATVYLTDDRGTTVTLATYTFRRADLGDTSSIALYAPEINHNILDEGQYWMRIKPSGWISGYQGRQVQLVTRFYYNNETPLYASPQETTYRDADGLVATATQPFEVKVPTLYLGEKTMYIPYRALNLPNTGGQATYELFLFIDVFVDGQLRKQSERLPFTVKW